MQVESHSCPIEGAIARASKMRSLKKAEIIKNKRMKLQGAASTILPFCKDEEMLDKWLSCTDQREVNRTAELLVAHLQQPYLRKNALETLINLTYKS